MLRGLRRLIQNILIFASCSYGVFLCFLSKCVMKRGGRQVSSFITVFFSNFFFFYKTKNGARVMAG